MKRAGHSPSDGESSRLVVAIAATGAVRANRRNKPARTSVTTSVTQPSRAALYGRRGISLPRRRSRRPLRYGTPRSPHGDSPHTDRGCVGTLPPEALHPARPFVDRGGLCSIVPKHEAGPLGDPSGPADEARAWTDPATYDGAAPPVARI